MPKRRLKDSADIRRFLAYLITATESGTMEVAKGKSLTYMAQTLWRVISESELEERVNALEKLLGDASELKKTN